MLYCDPILIETQPKGSFAAHVRGVTKSALPLKFPFGHMEAMDRMTSWECDALREAMRKRYAVHYTELSQLPEGAGADDRGHNSTSDRPSDPDNIDTNAASEW